MRSLTASSRRSRSAAERTHSRGQGARIARNGQNGLWQRPGPRTRLTGSGPTERATRVRNCDAAAGNIIHAGKGTRQSLPVGRSRFGDLRALARDGGNSCQRRRERCRGRRGLLVRRAHPVEARRPGLSRDGQRRLRQRAHRPPHRLRDGDQPVPARHPRRPRPARDAVPERLQPRLRAHERQRQRAEHDGQLGPGERRRCRVHVQAADLPGQPERPGRPRPARARHLQRQPGQRHQPQPAGLLPVGGQQHAERPTVPGQQAGHHARRADPDRHDLHRHGQLHRASRRPHRR